MPTAYSAYLLCGMAGMGLLHCTAALLVSEVQNNWKLEGWKRGRANDDDIASPEAPRAPYHLRHAMPLCSSAVLIFVGCTLCRWPRLGQAREPRR